MPDKLLINSLKRPRKYYVILGILVIISVFFFGTVSLFYETMIYMKYGGNEYGFQHCTMYDTSEETIDKLCAENGIEKTIRFERTVIPISEERVCYIDAVPEDYFSFTEYRLATGTFPHYSDEICCESSFLFEMGVPHDEFIGCKIKLGDTIYTVTGTFTVNRLWSTFGFNEAHCFTTDPKGINSVAFSAVSIQRCQSIMNVYERKCSDCVYNMNLWAISRNTSQIHSYYQPVMILMIAVMAAVFFHFIVMILMYHRKNMGIIKLIGIPINKVRKGLMLCLLSDIFLSAIIGMAGCFGCIGIIRKLYDYTYGADVTEFTRTNGAKQIITIAALITAIYSLVSLAAVFLKTQKTSLESVRNTKALKIRRRETNEKITDRYIAKRHIKASKLSNILTFIVILFLMCSLPTTKLYFRSATQSTDEYQDYDYVADIDNDIAFGNMYQTAEAFLKTVSYPNIKGCTAFPVYSSYGDLTVKKEYITDKYKDVLSQNSTLQLKLNDNFTDTVDIPFLIVGISEEEQKKLGVGLADAEAIAYRKVSDLNGRRIVGIKDVFFTDIKVDDEYSLNVIAIEDEYSGPVPSSSAYTVLVVSPSTYKELFGENDIPSRVLYKVTKEAENELTSLFAGKSYIKFTDVNEIKQNNRQVQIMDKIYYIITSMSFIFIVLNCLVIAYINVKNNSREYAVMSALGISKHHISRMLAYQLCSVIIISLIISDIFSLIYTSIYLDSMNEISKIKYTMPYSEILVCNILMILSCIVVLLLFIRKFWKSAAKDRLHE